MPEQIYVSSDQKHYIDPWNQRVFQYNTDNSDVFLSRVANTVFRIFGDDIVLTGLNLTGVAHSPDSVSVSLMGGDVLQDTTLLKIPDPVIELELAGLSGLDINGRIVVMSNYRYLETFEKNDHKFQINYISESGEPLLGFDETRDRVLLGIMQFRKDASDNVVEFFVSPEMSLDILGKTYYIRGFSPENKRLTAYILHQLFNIASGFSVILDDVDGIKLRGDVVEPGSAKYYGTGATGQKGFFDISQLSFDNASDIVDYMGDFNQVLYNGNLFFVRPGYNVAQVYGPPPLEWFNLTDNTFWEATSGGTWNVDHWEATENDMILTPSASGWPTDFRPMQLQVTGTVTGSTITIRDTQNNVIASSPGTGGTVTMDISFQGYDIASLHFEGYATVTDIQFESVPPAPQGSIPCACNCNYVCTCDCNYAVT